ncbi:MAG: putative sugar O-methyltransferase [Hydrocarboniphaga sp.]|uniref:putative sugar O-methyltransferase n=1 Tax=Hydrocarboniphaga sp. TaxID=2033016 RepID=UPI00263414B3|nr:putative sugar O-methyltransferase [Hydrocarboniphaga sp.]MDB5971551.1 putative sugar O-methyltransferase [Hydrocarboniphaga sp.]
MPPLGGAAAKDPARRGGPVTLPRWAADRFEVEADPELLRRLISDMEQHGGDLKPAECWMLPEQVACGPMSGLLDDWCGVIGQMPFVEQAAAGGEYAKRFRQAIEFAQAIDHSGMLTGVPPSTLAAAHWRVLDWNSLVDFSLITAFCPLPNQGARLLEIGGGFGRIPEFFSLAGYRNLKYVNVDAVPASLMYCHEYLRRRFPEKKVSVYLGQDRAAIADVDFLIVPAWRAAQALADDEFELSINIESFQEMSQPLVDHYIALLDRHTVKGGCVYMTNSRGYKFTGEYRFPAHWESVFRHRTLRAWTLDHPTEIFRKRGRPSPASHRVREYFYRQELQAAQCAIELAKRGEHNGRKG